MKSDFVIENMLLGVTGSIGIISYADYILMFREKLVKNIRIIMSKSATKFITPFSLRVYSGNDVYTDSFDIADNIYIPHLELVRKSNLFLILPATANTIGKLANGISDNLITTCVIAARVPVVIVPGMNSDMWFSNANQRNVKLVKELGYHIMEPKRSEKSYDSIINFYHKREEEISISPIEYEEIVDFIKEIVG